MTTARTHQLVSVILPLRDQAELLAQFLPRLEEVLDAHFLHYEVVLVDDGSRDATPSVVADHLARHRHLRSLRFPRRFGLEAAISAGLEVAIGAVVVCLMPDRDPPNLVPELVRQCLANGSVLMGRPRGRERERTLRSLGRRAFYWACRRLLDVRMEPHGSYFLVLPRVAVTALNRMDGRSRFLRALHGYTGFRYETFDYEQARSDSPEAFRRTWPELVSLAIEVVVTNSTRPLRWAGLLAFTVASVNLAYAGYVVVVNLARDRVVEGWTTLSLQLAMTFWGLALTLAVVAEYLGRVLVEAQRRPTYMIEDERISSVAAAETERPNVVARTEFQ